MNKWTPPYDFIDGSELDNRTEPKPRTPKHLYITTVIPFPLDPVNPVIFEEAVEGYSRAEVERYLANKYWNYGSVEINVELVE